MTNKVESAIKFEDVSFVLPGGRRLLANLNLQVGIGETLVLLGRSGSGKTTTMKLINRLIRHRDGLRSKASRLSNGIRSGCAGASVT